MATPFFPERFPDGGLDGTDWERENSMSVNNILNISESGIIAAQTTLQTVSHNLSNVNTPGYSRQGVTLLNSSMGLGVQVQGITQQVDQLLDRRQELGMSETGALETKDKFLSQIEQVFNESSGSGLNSRMSDLYTSADSLVDDPTNVVGREDFVTKANGVAQYVGNMSQTLTGLLTPVDQQVDVLLADVNNRLKALRDVNAQIAGSAPGDPIADLKDQRRQMILDLGKEINIQTLDLPNGGVQIMMAGGQGLLADTVHAATLARSATNAVDPTVVPQTNPPTLTKFPGISMDGRDLLNIQGGQLGGLLEVRDTLINGKNGFATQLDGLANELRFQFNSVASTGVSQGMSTSQTGVFLLGDNLDAPMQDPTTGASPTGSPPDLSRVQDGNIVFATGADATHLSHMVTIPVTASMSINQLMEAINGATDQNGAPGNMTASITTGNTLRIQGPTGQVYGAVSDGSHVLAALGIGALFGGTGARDMTVNPALLDNSGTLGVGNIANVYGNPSDPTQVTGATFDDADNAAALAMSQLRTTSVTINGFNGTLTAQYASTVGKLGAVVNQNTSSKTAQDAGQSFLDTLRQSTSGVSAEEELTDLLRFQRAFQASSKMVTVADQLMQYIVGMV